MPKVEENAFSAYYFIKTNRTKGTNINFSHFSSLCSLAHLLYCRLLLADTMNSTETINQINTINPDCFT